MFMFSNRSMTSLVAGITLVFTASGAWAQPANRPAAFQSAITAAGNQAPGWGFYEASLQNDSGQWRFEIQVVSASGTAMLEYEIDPVTFAVIQSRSKSLSAGKIAEIQGVIAKFPSATVSISQAFGLVGPRTPDGTQLQQLEMGVENSHLAYKFDFMGTSDTQRLTVDGVTGTVSGGNGGVPPIPDSGDLTLEQAVQAALVAYPGAKILHTELEAFDARWEIKLVTAAGVVREFRISTGGVALSDDQPMRSREDAAEDRVTLNAVASATITLAQAKVLAAAATPGATAIKAEWEFEHGTLLAKVKLQDSIGFRTVFINATTGAVVTPTPDAPPAAPPVPVLGGPSAAVIAVGANPGSTAIEIEMETKGGRQFYKVKTLSGATPLRLREVVVDGKTGVVWSNTLLPMANAYLPTAQKINSLLPTVAQTMANAQTIALATLADGMVTQIEIEAKTTYLVYNVSVLVGQKTFVLVVDSRTGAVAPK
jgi:uncharacterized membrane protein YkoI